MEKKTNEKATLHSSEFHVGIEREDVSFQKVDLSSYIVFHLLCDFNEVIFCLLTIYECTLHKTCNIWEPTFLYSQSASRLPQVRNGVTGPSFWFTQTTTSGFSNTNSSPSLNSRGHISQNTSQVFTKPYLQISRWWPIHLLPHQIKFLSVTL